MIRHSPLTWGPRPGALPPPVPHGGKTVHQPQRRRRVAAVLHEGEPFGVGDEVAGEFHGADQRAVGRLLIVEMEAVVGVTDGMDALVERDPFLTGPARGGEAPRLIIGRWNRVLRER